MAIRISPEQVRAVGAQFQTAGRQSSDLAAGLRRLVDEVQAEWEGQSRQHFSQEFEAWQAELQQFVEQVEAIGSQLYAIAAMYEAIDRDER